VPAGIAVSVMVNEGVNESAGVLVIVAVD